MRFPRLACAALALAALLGSPARAGEAASGWEIYERRCGGCHGGSAPFDPTFGPSLAGIVGTRAGTQAAGVHSRAVMDSGILWDRNSLRRFLSDPRLAIPGTLMPVSVADPEELECLLDYLEALR